MEVCISNWFVRIVLSCNLSSTEYQNLFIENVFGVCAQTFSVLFNLLCVLGGVALNISWDIQVVFLLSLQNAKRYIIPKLSEKNHANVSQLQVYSWSGYVRQSTDVRIISEVVPVESCYFEVCSTFTSACL